jgi:long-chain fatty acid transport protein
MSKARVLGYWAAATCLLLAPAIGWGSGFGLFEHGARGMALGGAFGATADDATAMYFNPAGIAFLPGTQLAMGVTFITESATLHGADPYPGKGYTVDMKKQIFYPMHAYVTGELSGNLHWGMGVYNPFGLGTWWPSDYAGKYISKRVDLKVFDFIPTLAYKVSDNFALAAGADYFSSTLSLTQSLGAINPYTQSVAEVGQVHLYTDPKGGWGWHAAMLAKMEGGFSLGLTYRSEVTVDYDGTASFNQFPTGHADFDAIVHASLPFDHAPAAKTKITYPSQERVALAWHGGGWGFEADWVRDGWSSFQNLPITVVGWPSLSQVRYEGFKDTDNWRVGIERRTSPSFAWQLGYVHDNNPMPDRSVSVLLPDSDRNGYCVGASMNFSPKSRLDIAYMYLPFKDRSTHGVNDDNFNGDYKTTAHLLGFTWSYKF